MPVSVGHERSEFFESALFLGHRVGGAFLVYQFSDRARDFMARHFRHIDSGFEPLNVLPCKLFWGWKRADD